MVWPKKVKKRLKALYLHRHVLRDLIILQFKAKYAGSKLGIWWAVVTPLILALCINFIFTIVFKIKMENFTLFALAGLIPWLFFNNAVIEATNSFIISGPMLKQSIFPREIIPISSVISNLINFFIGFIFLLPIFVTANFKVLGLLLSLLLLIAVHTLFIVGLGLLLSCINVFTRDVIHFLSLALMTWFWITPIFYFLDMVNFPYRWICLFNPMTYYVLSYQQILFKATSPSFLNLTMLLFIAIFFLVAGYAFFLKKEAALLKRI